MIHTILGSGGAIGIELAKSLIHFPNVNIRLVSRNPKKVNEEDELFQADLFNLEDVIKAVKGSEVVYLTVGLDYNTKLWQEKWPKLMKNVIEACKTTNSKLIFFDNVYGIGKEYTNHIKEDSPLSPSSEKGKVRATLDEMIMKEVKSGTLQAIIARSPDFFSEVKEKSVVMNLIYDNLIKGKSAQWFCNKDVIHSVGYCPDLAAGMAILGNNPESFKDIVWNLPCSEEKITGQGWVDLFAKEMKTNQKVSTLPKWGMKILGLFVPILKEMVEMAYQYDKDYYFDSSKFNKTFNYSPKTNIQAVKNTVEILSKGN